jgi:hypothetical protein
MCKVGEDFLEAWQQMHAHMNSVRKHTFSSRRLEMVTTRIYG